MKTREDFDTVEEWREYRRSLSPAEKKRHGSLEGGKVTGAIAHQQAKAPRQKFIDRAISLLRDNKNYEFTDLSAKLVKESQRGELPDRSRRTIQDILRENKQHILQIAGRL